ncbi:MAG: MBL fold metallo-hydrolase [Proteobacteria bacterium]|nr:MBL fold metallo-hydrolase [Pseudomonadota bacterium]|tara:strand:+ start:1514 stop:2461 length:948 start_codon:yes stop_codon:yes gene_type:complete
MTDIISFDKNIFCFDANYIRKKFAAIHFIKKNNKLLIIDTATNHSANRFLSALRTLNISPESVEWIVLTHVHLDHSGGAGLLMRMCQNARLAVHQRGVRHMVNPEKLWASVVSVYGKEEAENQYGQLIPVDENRIIAMGEGEIISFQNRRLQIFDAPGHANHHIVIFDEESKSFFTGDAFGIAYPELTSENGEFVFISSTPTQFEPVKFHTTIKKIMEQKPKSCFLTHFSKIMNIEKNGYELLKQIDEYVTITEQARNNHEDRQDQIRGELFELLYKKIKNNNLAISRREFGNLLGLDLSLNAQGLIYWNNKTNR